MGHPGARLRQELELLVVEVDAVGEPHVGPCPPQGAEVGQGAHAELGEGVLLLVPGLRQVGVEPHPQLPGQDGGLPQQVGGYGEGGAGGQGYLAHGVAALVVPDVYQPLGVVHDLVDGLDHRVGRQAPVLFGQVHGPPGGVEPDAQLPGGPELGGDQVPRPGGKDVVVVKAGGAPRFQQLPHAGEGGAGHHLLVQVLPHLVQGHQPGEELHPLHLWQVAGENLVEVVVGVDEAGVDHHVPGVDHLVGLVALRADGGDDAVPDEEIGVVVEPVPEVAGDNIPGVFDQQGRHNGHLRFSSAPGPPGGRPKRLSYTKSIG